MVLGNFEFRWRSYQNVSEWVRRSSVFRGTWFVILWFMGKFHVLKMSSSKWIFLAFVFKVQICLICSKVLIWIQGNYFLFSGEIEGEQVGREGERNTERKRGEKKKPCLLVHSPNSCVSWGWMDLHPGARNFSWVSHMNSRKQTMWVISCCLPGSDLVGSWNWESEPGIEP